LNEKSSPRDELPPGFAAGVGAANKK